MIASPPSCPDCGAILVENPRSGVGVHCEQCGWPTEPNDRLPEDLEGVAEVLSFNCGHPEHNQADFVRALARRCARAEAKVKDPGTFCRCLPGCYGPDPQPPEYYENCPLHGRLALNLKEAEAKVAELEGFRDRFAVLADALLDDHFEYMDLDSLDREGLLIEAGVLERTKATADDVKQDWAMEYDIKEGDPCTKWTPLAREIAARAAQIRKERDAARTKEQDDA